MHARAHDYYRTGCPDHCGRAGRWAARRLITPRQFLTAARKQGRITDLAADLAVTTADVLNYFDSLTQAEIRIMLRLVGHPLK